VSESSPPRLGRSYAIRRIFHRAYTPCRTAGDVSTCFKRCVLKSWSCPRLKSCACIEPENVPLTDNLAVLVAAPHPHKPASRRHNSSRATLFIPVVQPQRASGSLCDRKPKVSFVKLSRQMIWSEQGGVAFVAVAVVGTLKCTGPLRINISKYSTIPSDLCRVQAFCFRPTLLHLANCACLLNLAYG
jgi:hypothetical protein